MNFQAVRKVTVFLGNNREKNPSNNNLHRHEILLTALINQTSKAIPTNS